MNTLRRRGLGRRTGSPRSGQRRAGSARPADPNRLLDERLIGRLRYLSLAAPADFVHGVAGERRALGAGQDAEFADYRPYAAGDDLRMIDWNVYQRLGELFVKVSPGEGRIELSILLDCSRSMDFGQVNKLLHAKRLAAALGAIALLHGDSARVYECSDGRARQSRRFLGAGALPALTHELVRAPAGSRTDLGASVAAYRRACESRSIAVLVSDLLTDEHPDAAIRALTADGRRGVVMHVVDESELDPPQRGVLELIDSETDGRRLVSLSAAVRERYGELLAARLDVLRRACDEVGCLYLRAATSVDALDLISGPLRAAGMVIG